MSAGGFVETLWPDGREGFLTSGHEVYDARNDKVGRAGCP